MKPLDIIAYASIITGVVSAPFFLFSCVPYLASRNSGPASPVAAVSFLVFVLSIVVGLSASWTEPSVARVQVIEKLMAAGDSCQISINGKPAQNSKQILAVLRTLHTSPGHHSDPTHAINIGISYDSERMMLRLARDSADPKEYWVFFPKYWSTSTKEIGRIETSVFDSY
jgi:hypothetical protein